MSYRDVSTEDLAGQARVLYHTLRQIQLTCKRDGRELPSTFHQDELNLIAMLDELANRRSAEWHRYASQAAH